MEGLDRYRRLAGSDGPPYLRFGGALAWGPVAAGAWDHLRSCGYPAEWLEAAEVPRRVPGVEAAAVPPEGALLTPEEGWVELLPFVEALAAELTARGGRVVPGAGRADLLVDGGSAAGVSTSEGLRIDADAVVLATGAGTPRAAAALGVDVPDGTVPALLVRTVPARTRLEAVLNTPRVSVRPTAEGGLAFDSGWSEAAIRTREDGTSEVPEGIVEQLVDEARQVLEGAPPLAVASCGVGPKPVPGDGRPVVGELDEVPGCYVAFTHSGATLGLVIGELLAAEIVGGRRSPLLAPFRPGRFA
jgi:glycine/D-amino acid oxidase-like deaminating enzyme